jgi:pyridoxal phosphate enzyme (YggS family)
MVKDKLAFIQNQISENVTLVAVSKTQPISAIQEAYDNGQRVFGENKVQELVDKFPLLPNDIKWHLIGHLQSNKVKYIASFVALIHSVDSLKLLQEINKQALNNERIIDCLLQFHVAEEDTKFGLTLEEAKEFLDSIDFALLKNIRIVGIMGMASFTNDTNQVRSEFQALKNIFNQLKTDYFSTESSFKEISMGMSGDFQIAIEEGSTMVRVGSSIFN